MLQVTQAFFDAGFFLTRALRSTATSVATSVVTSTASSAHLQIASYEKAKAKAVATK